MEMGVLCIMKDSEIQEKFTVIAVGMRNFIKRDG